MLLRFLSRAEWEAKLRRMGCRPLEGLGPLNSAEWWKGPRGVFVVPVEDDGTCDFWRIARISGWYREPEE